jgi:hypothetical protein
MYHLALPAFEQKLDVQVFRIGYGAFLRLVSLMSSTG